MHDSGQAGQGHREEWLPQSVREAGVNRVLDTGDFLFRIDTPTVGLFEVIKGRIKLVRIAPSGRETILYTASAGAFVAEASLFSPTYHCDAVATADAVVRLYPKGRLFAAFREDPATAQAFMAVLAREIMRLRTRLDLRNIRTARDRVRHHLILNAEADGCTVILSGTLKDLAGELGLTHEALYRTLADMAADGEIERLEGKIILKFPTI